MGKKGQIEHEGIVREIRPENVKVGFVAQPGCVGCHAKGVCNLEQQNGEILDVPFYGGEKFKIGEKVKIIIKESMGLKAVLYAYLLPFILVIISLIVFVSIFGDDQELKAGFMALSILVPYYFMIYICRGKFKKDFSFTIEKF